MKSPVRVTITGAAGQIGYQLAFRIASGQMLGQDQPVILQLLEIPPALPALAGVVMELEDCALRHAGRLRRHWTTRTSLSRTVITHSWLAARPRGPGMERNDLLEANAAIFSVQGKAINEHASRDIRVLVVGNPANTNARIASANAPDIDSRRFTAMTRLDHNRATAQLAARTDSHVTDIRCLTIWGNHSATQYPDVFHATVNGKPAAELVDEAWLAEEFIPTVQQRGAAIIKARGASSAASAASAAIDHMHDWALGSRDGDWVSMGVPADGSYGIAEGVVYSYPVRCSNGEYEIVQGLDINDFSRERMAATEAELREERAAIESLL